jgi:hypothetical protein
MDKLIRVKTFSFRTWSRAPASWPPVNGHRPGSGGCRRAGVVVPSTPADVIGLVVAASARDDDR